MLKILSTALVAITLFVTGAYYLLTIKKDLSTPDAMVIDYEPSCNDTTYLLEGSSFDDSPELKSAIKANVGKEFLLIKDGETLHSILKAKHVSEVEIARLGLALKPYLLARDIAPNDHYRFDLVELDSTTLVYQFVIRKLDPNRVPILYTATRADSKGFDASFMVTVTEPPIQEEDALIALELKGTLYQTFNQIPFGAELMQRFINVFVWEIRMPEEVSQGDTIEILVKKKYVENEFIGYGNINSVYYRQKSREFFATFFASQDEKIQGFFDEKGNSLEREFAHSPVYETTATSDQKWRFHPVRKMRIRHNGIDYRGTIGTEFFSIADGEVVEKRYDKNVGNMIRIRHKYGVYSEYFHADSLSDRLREGSRVKRGQKLGTIGRTGKLCTGPHLHMGLYKMQGEKRKFIELSSLKKILKPAPSINQAYRAEFKRHVDKLVAEMEKHQKPILADSIGQKSVSR